MNEINLQTGVSRLGYGVVGANICVELSKKIGVNLFPIGPIEVTEQKNKESIDICLKNARTADFKATTVKIWHQHQLIEHVGTGKYIGWPIFELNEFNRDEKWHLRAPDELIVCSQWAKDVCEANNIKTPYVVPLGIDPAIFNSAPPNAGTYKFFTIGKNEIRKGHDIIARCFHNAFDDDDDVELHMITHNPFIENHRPNNHDWYNSFKNGPLSDKVFIHNPLASHMDVANLIKSFDCGVFPSRAEGWNLELLETMACNRPVITTDYSAHTEFCNPDNAFLIGIDKTEPALDGFFFTSGIGHWASLRKYEEDILVVFMRQCYRQNIRENKPGVLTGQKFTWEQSASKLLEIL